MLHINRIQGIQDNRNHIFQQNGMNRHLIGGIIYDKIAM